MFVCLFAVNAKTTERIDSKRSRITKNYPESVLCGLKSPVLVLVYNFQAHQPSPRLESAEQYQSGTPKSSMLIADRERAIVLKGMYINLIRDLHQLATSGALSEDEYQLQKTVIVRQMLDL